MILLTSYQRISRPPQQTAVTPIFTIREHVCLRAVLLRVLLLSCCFCRDSHFDSRYLFFFFTVHLPSSTAAAAHPPQESIDPEREKRERKELEKLQKERQKLLEEEKRLSQQRLKLEEKQREEEEKRLNKMKRKERQSQMRVHGRWAYI